MQNKQPDDRNPPELSWPQLIGLVAVGIFLLISVAQ